MRFVRRRFSRLPKPPWERRERSRSGAPRTLLTNQREPVYLQHGNVRVKAGEYDFLLRLYQHRGATRGAVRTPEGIAYHRTEWEYLQTVPCLWLEFVDDDNQIAYRVDRGTGSRYGSWDTNAWGDIFVIPEDRFTTEEQYN